MVKIMTSNLSYLLFISGYVERVCVAISNS